MCVAEEPPVGLGLFVFILDSLAEAFVTELQEHINKVKLLFDQFDLLIILVCINLSDVGFDVLELVNDFVELSSFLIVLAVGDVVRGSELVQLVLAELEVELGLAKLLGHRLEYFIDLLYLVLRRLFHFLQDLGYLRLLDGGRLLSLHLVKHGDCLLLTELHQLRHLVLDSLACRLEL